MEEELGGGGGGGGNCYGEMQELCKNAWQSLHQ